METPVRQQHGAELCQQPGWAWKPILPRSLQKKSWLADTLILACETLSRETRWNIPPTQTCDSQNWDNKFVLGMCHKSNGRLPHLSKQPWSHLPQTSADQVPIGWDWCSTLCPDLSQVSGSGNKTLMAAWLTSILPQTHSCPQTVPLRHQWGSLPSCQGKIYSAKPPGWKAWESSLEAWDKPFILSGP